MAKEEASKKPKQAPKRGKLLQKRINLPVRGKLGQAVGVPRWLRAIGNYFAGAWQELREVRWPTRRATWGLTSAVLVFTIALAAFILALDFGFEQLFKRILL